MHHPLAWIDEELRALDAQDLRRAWNLRQGAQGATVHIDGRTLINFGSNDYLGLAADPRICQAAASAMRQEGWGAGASPLVTGRGESLARLEQSLAQFEGAEAAIVFPSGFAANLGAVTALAGRGDAIFADEKNHASLIDGCRLSRADVQIFPHRDCEHLAELLAAAPGEQRKLIVTDSVFSMDGDLAPLPQLVELAESFEAMLLIDEAHATGVFGHGGRGLAEQLGVEDRVHVRVGTLSKALGSLGGFVCGSRPLIDWLMNRARPYVFSTALPPPVCAAAIAALHAIAEEPRHGRELLRTADRFRGRLNEQGWRTGGTASQIIPLIIGDAAETMRLSAALNRKGMLVPGIRPPSVPAGQSLLRISLSRAHTEEMLESLLAALGPAA